MPTLLRLFTAAASTGAFAKPFSSDPAVSIRSIGINNPSASAIQIRMADATNADNTLILSPGTYEFRRINTGSLEIKSNTTNSAVINIWAGNVENSA